MKDYRYQKTEKQILDATTRLAMKKDIYSLTVTEIAKEANINRITFYSHYENIDTLVKHLENLHIENGFEWMTPFSDLIYKPEEFLKRSMELYHTNSSQIFFSSSRKEQFLQKAIHAIVQRTLEECSISDDNFKKKIVFIEHGIYGIFNEYDIDDTMILQLAQFIHAVLT